MGTRTNHCVYNINYHIVFCPKYRHRVIKGKVEEILKKAIQDTCRKYGYTLIQIEATPDHLHIFLSAPPNIAPTAIVKTLKSVSANSIFKAFPDFKKRYYWGSGLWRGLLHRHCR